MSDRIGVMREGKLAQVGSPATIYTQPENRFVTEFMGEVNSLPVRLADDGRLHCEALDAGFDPPPDIPSGFASGVLIVRPENVAISDDPAPAAVGNLIRGELFNEYLLGSRIQYQVKSGAMVFLIEELRADAVARLPGAEVTLSWGKFPLAYFTSGADVTVPEWLYGKMIGGYTSMVPAVGLTTVVLGGIILAVGLTINGMILRRD